MGKEDIDVIVEVTKSPRGYLAPGAQMTGTVEIINNTKRDFVVMDFILELCEAWNDTHSVYAQRT